MKKVSSLWTLVLWFVPDWLLRWLPPWVTENVERAVYDGMTRSEWFEAQVNEIHEAQRRRALESNSEEPSK